jgi:hypothetical protein
MTRITQEEAQERIAGVLKAAGIKAEIAGCSCCGIFDVEFPDGARINTDEVWIKCDGLSHQRAK